MNADEWTPMIGLRRALVALLWRSVIWLVIWAGLVWLCTPALNLVPVHWAWFGLLAVILAAPGMVLGHGLSKNLTERAGFGSPLVTALAAIFVWAVIFGGVEIAAQLRPLDDWRITFTGLATSLFATLWIVKATLFDE